MIPTLEEFLMQMFVAIDLNANGVAGWFHEAVARLSWVFLFGGAQCVVRDSESKRNRGPVPMVFGKAKRLPMGIVSMTFPIF